MRTTAIRPVTPLAKYFDVKSTLWAKKFKEETITTSKKIMKDSVK